jgi:Glycosyl transferases group 1
VPDTVARFGEEVAQRACFELADAVVSPSEWLAAWMREHRWPLREPVHVIRNLWESVALGEAAQQAQTGSRIERLAFFGQLREGKGLGVFLAALRRLDPGLLDGVEVVFLGHSRRASHAQIADALGRDVVERLVALRVETRLDRTAAIEELRKPGTLAVMPSLLENSPYAVAECIEHGIPFLAADVGGTPELVARDDRARVLHPPTRDAFAAALAEALRSPDGFEPARPARRPEETLDAWLDLVETVEPASRHETPTRTDDFAVLGAAPEPGLVDALRAAQAASGADVVTTGVRVPGGVRLFLGEPGSLGLVENHYGTIGLIRSSLLPGDAATAPAWVLYARLALAGARIVSIPEPLAAGDDVPATPAERLAVLEAFEAATPEAYADLPQLSATLAAALARVEADGFVTPSERSLVRRARARLRLLSSR